MYPQPTLSNHGSRPVRSNHPVGGKRSADLHLFCPIVLLINGGEACPGDELAHFSIIPPAIGVER